MIKKTLKFENNLVIENESETITKEKKVGNLLITKTTKIEKTTYTPIKFIPKNESN